MLVLECSLRSSAHKIRLKKKNKAKKIKEKKSVDRLSPAGFSKEKRGRSEERGLKCGGLEMSTEREQGMVGSQNREKRKSLFFSLLLSLPPTLLPSMIN